MKKLLHHHDNRGMFYELWNGDPGLDIKQVNVSHSKKGVIRGIHFEPWDKFIHVISGKVLAVIVNEDGTHEEYTIDNTHALYVPKGKGNSYQALEDSIYLYLVTDTYKPDIKHKAIHFKSIDVNWPVTSSILSEKDQNA